MNIEAYDADSLRKMVRLLEYENKILKDKLKKAGISYEEVNPFEEKIESAEEYDLDQGNRIVNPPYITEKMAICRGMNLLGKADVWDNLMRIRNSQVATELLEIALGCSEERRKSE